MEDKLNLVRNLIYLPFPYNCLRKGKCKYD